MRFSFSGPNIASATLHVTFDSATVGMSQNRVATLNVIYQRSFLRLNLISGLRVRFLSVVDPPSAILNLIVNRSIS